MSKKSPSYPRTISDSEVFRKSEKVTVDGYIIKKNVKSYQDNSDIFKNFKVRDFQLGNLVESGVIDKMGVVKLHVPNDDVAEQRFCDSVRAAFDEKLKFSKVVEPKNE